jgi:hypothetical protein
LIKNWVGTLHSIQKYARSPGLVPPQIILNYKDRKTEYLTDVFGEYRRFVRHPDEESLIEKNFWYAAALAYEIKEWPKLEQIPKPKKIKSKDIDKLSTDVFGLRFEQLTADQQQAIIRVGQEREEVQIQPVAEVRDVYEETPRDTIGIRQEMYNATLRQFTNTAATTRPAILQPLTYEPPEWEPEIEEDNN